VRILGDVTQKGALDLLRKADDIYINAIRRHGLYDDIWQVSVLFMRISLQFFCNLLQAERQKVAQEPE
jgi:GMP synthase PP-ATPase subunit